MMFSIYIVCLVALALALGQATACFNTSDQPWIRSTHVLNHYCGEASAEVSYCGNIEGFEFDSSRNQVIASFGTNGVALYDAVNGFTEVSTVEHAEYNVIATAFHEQSDTLWHLKLFDFSFALNLVGYKRSTFSNGVVAKPEVYISIPISIDASASRSFAVSPEGIVFAVDGHGRVLKYDPEKAESEVIGGICKEVLYFSSMVYHNSGQLIVKDDTTDIWRFNIKTREWSKIRMESEPFREHEIYQGSLIPSIVFLRDGRLVVVSSTHIHLIEEVPTNDESWSQARTVSRVRTTPNLDDDKRRFVCLAQHDLEIHILHLDTIDFAPVLWVDTISFQAASSLTSLHPDEPDLMLDNPGCDRIVSAARSLAFDSFQKQVIIFSKNEFSRGNISFHDTTCDFKKLGGFSFPDDEGDGIAITFHENSKNLWYLNSRCILTRFRNPLISGSESNAFYSPIQFPMKNCRSLTMSPGGIAFVVNNLGQISKYDTKNEFAQPEIVGNRQLYVPLPSSIAYHESGQIMVVHAWSTTLRRIDIASGEGKEIVCVRSSNENAQVPSKLQRVEVRDILEQPSQSTRGVFSLPSLLFLRDGRLVVVTCTHVHLLQELEGDGERWSKALVIMSRRLNYIPPRFEGRLLASLSPDDLAIYILADQLHFVQFPPKPQSVIFSLEKEHYSHGCSVRNLLLCVVVCASLMAFYAIVSLFG